MRSTLRLIPVIFLLMSVLIACEQEGNPEGAAQTPPPTSSAIANTPPPAPAPTPVPIVEKVLDTIPVVTRAERPSRSPAKITFIETSHVYDTIQQGEVIEYEFKFKNEGERPLSIKDVKGSCGCTIGSYPFLDIAPNEVSSIKARFDSKGKVGPQFTTITVYSNANAKGDVLSLKGVVLEPTASDATK